MLFRSGEHLAGDQRLGHERDQQYPGRNLNDEQYDVAATEGDRAGGWHEEVFEVKGDESVVGS